MKKYIILVLLLVIILISAFFVLKINQTNDLYISFNINNEIYEMGVTPVVTLEDLENLKEQQILVKRDMESVVFDSLKDGVYRVYLSLENKIFEEKEISIKNNEFLKLSQKHSIAFLVEVPRKIQKFEMTVLDNTPELKWKTKGAVVPDKYIIEFGDKEIVLSGDKERYVLLQEDLDYIYSNDIKDVCLHVIKSDNVLDSNSINTIPVLFKVDFIPIIKTGDKLTLKQELPFVSELYKSKIYINDIFLRALSGQSTLNLQLEELIPYLKTNKTLSFKIITEYNNFVFSENKIDIPVYSYNYDLVASYELTDDISVSETTSDVITNIKNNKLCVYSFEPIEFFDILLAYKGEKVFDSKVAFDEKAIKLFELDELRLENMRVDDSKIHLAFNYEEKDEQEIAIQFLEINKNGEIDRLDFATSVFIENNDKKDLNLKITPLFFNTLESTPINVIAKRYEIQFDIPILLSPENISIKIDSEEYTLEEKSVVFYNTKNSENVIVSVNYNGNLLFETKQKLSPEQNIEIEVPAFEKIQISNAVFTNENIDLHLEGVNPATAVTFKPDYYYLLNDGEKIRFDTPDIKLKNVNEAGEYSIIPVYKNNIEGNKVLYRKPEKLRVDLDYEEKTLNENTEIIISVHPIDSQYDYNVQKLVGENYVDIEVKEKGEKIILPLSDTGNNKFKVFVKDQYNQTFSKSFEINRINSPEIQLEEFNFINGKLFARWTDDAFYDYYTVTYNYDGQEVETKTTTENTIEIMGVDRKLSVSVVGNHNGLTRICLDTTIDVTDYVQNSTMASYATEKTKDSKMNLLVRFNNQTFLNLLNIQQINSKNELIDEKTFNQTELNSFQNKEIESIWEVVPGETYTYLFDYEYIYNREGKQLYFSNHEKSLEIYAERPDELEVKALYQLDKESFFVQTNDFGKNILYEFKISDGEKVISFESESCTNILSVSELFSDYTGNMKLNIQVKDSSGEIICETNKGINKINADIYLYGDLGKNQTYFSKRVCISDVVSVSTGIYQKFNNCDLVFDEDVYFDLFYSNIEIINSTITSITSNEGRKSKHLSNDYLIRLENSSLKISGSDVRNIEKFIFSNFNSQVTMENCNFLNVMYPMESSRSFVELSNVGAYNSIRFFDSIYDQNIVIKNSEFLNMTSGFTVANSELTTFSDVLLKDIQTEGIHIYDSNRVNLNDLTFEDNRIALKANNIILSIFNTEISDSLYGLVLQNTDFKAENITIKNSKEGLYLFNCFSQILNSFIETEDKGIFYNNELFKSPLNIMNDIDFADIESVQKNKVVSLIDNTAIKSETAIHIFTGNHNIVYKGLPPNGKIIHGGVDSRGVLNNKKIGQVIYLKQSENLDMNYDFAKGEENISAPTIPISEIMNIKANEEVTGTITNIEPPEEIMKKYKE